MLWQHADLLVRKEYGHDAAHHSSAAHHHCSSCRSSCCLHGSRQVADSLHGPVTLQRCRRKPRWLAPPRGALGGLASSTLPSRPSAPLLHCAVVERAEYNNRLEGVQVVRGDIKTLHPLLREHVCMYVREHEIVKVGQYTEPQRSTI